MKNLLIIISLVFLLPACGGKSADLEKQIQDLKAQLDEATDPARVRELQQEIREEAKESIKKQVEELDALSIKLRTEAKDKENCDRVNAQIEKEGQKIFEFAEKYQIPFYPLTVQQEIERKRESREKNSFRRGGGSSSDKASEESSPCTKFGWRDNP